jgi:hypothetical protein
MAATDANRTNVAPLEEQLHGRSHSVQQHQLMGNRGADASHFSEAPLDEGC